MTVVKHDNTLTTVLFIVVLVLSSLACVVSAFPVTTLTTPPTTLAPVITPVSDNIQDLYIIPSPTATLSPDMAQIVAPVVNVRAKPDGDVIGTLKAGDAVTVLSCDGNWCEIADPAGYVFKGCLSVESGLGCEAK